MMRRMQEESGAVAVIVAICLVALFGAAALAIDLGSGWTTKRDLVIDLDSAALAGAQRLGDELRAAPGACPSSGDATGTLQGQVEQTVDELLAANGGSAEDVDVVINCQRRTVLVSGTQPADMTLASLSGVDDLRAGGYAVAQVSAGTDGMVLPFAVCRLAGPVSSWLSSGAPEGATVVIDFSNHAEACGPSQGNWGWFGSGDTPGLQGFIENGYPGTITTAPTCEGPGASDHPLREGWCNAGTGVGPLVQHNNDPSLSDYTCSTPTSPTCQRVTFVTYSETAGSGTGRDYRPEGFIDAVITATTSTGSNSTITLRALEYRTGPGESSATATSTRLCSVDGAPAGDPNCVPT